MLAVLITVWLISVLAGLVAFGVVHAAFPNLPDRGYAVAKFVGLLLLSYPPWLLGHLGIAFSASNVRLIGGCLLAAGTLLFFLKARTLAAFFRNNLRTVVILEALFLLTLAAGTFLTGYYGAIDPDSERMMDYAMIQAVLKSGALPPQDLWFAGQPVNYYYFGYVLVAVLQLLSSAPLPLLFNVAVALSNAHLLSACFGLGYNFARTYRHAFLTCLLVGISGNLDGFLQILGGSDIGALDWFASARVIQGTINEFPYFSFLFGDLHPYVLAFPMAMVVFFVSLDMLLGQAPWRLGLRAALLAVFLGALLATNTWDFLPYFLLLPVTLLCVTLSRAQWDVASLIRRVALPAMVLLVLSLAAYAPFLLAFPQHRQIRMVAFSRTLFTDFIQVFGTPLVLGVGFLLLLALGVLNRRRLPRPWMLASFLATGAVLVFGQTTYLHLLAYMALCLWVLRLLWSPSRDAPTTPESDLPATGSLSLRAAYVVCLGFMAALYGLGCEFFYVDDHFTGVRERMNTVFKVYLEIWFFWTLAAAFASALLPRLGVGVRMRRIWNGALVVLLGMGLVYPLAGTYARTGGFGNPRSYDGMALLCREFPGDCGAIRWLEEHAEGMPVIMEAVASAYAWESRFSTFAGLPAVLGWANHEAGWRNAWDPVMERYADVERAYKTLDPQEAMAILEKYGVTYVVVGSLEKRRYPSTGLRKFELFMEPVYEDGGVILYKRNPALGSIGSGGEA